MSLRPAPPDIAPVRAFFEGLQADLVHDFEAIDGGAHFVGEELSLPGGGISRPRVLQGGERLEKAAVQFTHSVGAALPPAATDRNPHLAGKPFQATAVSVIVHPRNPYAPTAHMNLRFFLVDTGDVSTEESHWHFGGGFDLTPFYPFLEDVRHWHEVAQEAAGEHYAAMKQACDRYFYLPHRGETRGVGGLFFDDWRAGGFEASLGLAKAVGNAFADAYLPILRRRLDTPWGEREERWLAIRRGRYAEFNLALDRGTRYGLQSGRRVESVLASLPPRAAWVHGHQPEKGSPEAALKGFLRARDWLGGEHSD
ncbi:MAG: oxygen-dependent coproporphyrinogen oxidase [Gammaproteobacteria bacterium]|nr:oxygen-dependent coproporphyrinogen oxidase [Gammaproteobacteria bacterium]